MVKSGNALLILDTQISNVRKGGEHDGGECRITCDLRENLPT